MSTAIPKPCANPVCPNTTTGRYCEDCAKRVAQRFDRERADDPVRKLYRTATWRRTRMDVLMRDPVCKACGHAASAEVDHIEPARKIVSLYGESEFFNEERLQGLCGPCHSAKTATEVGWAGNNRA
jgi:5-methylcytosine-specific restriction protein A